MILGHKIKCDTLEFQEFKMHSKMSYWAFSTKTTGIYWGFLGTLLEDQGTPSWANFREFIVSVLKSNELGSKHGH